ncbi:MAG: aromatic ring-hydroxylating dioxygenase subunit alpha [Actinomycetota bacterium]
MRVPMATAADVDRFYAAARPFWHPVARTADVGAGAPLATELLGEDLVLWRTAGGGPAAADNVCPHRGTRLSMGTVTDHGGLRCPYHLWEFEPSGACTRIPQVPNRPIPDTVRVATYPTVDYAGLIWVCLDRDAADRVAPPRVPRAGDDGWWLYAGEPPTWSCQAPRMVENFLDLAHFGAIHAGNFGNPDVEEVAPYRPVTNRDERAITFEIDYLARYRWAPDEDGEPAVRQIHYRYRCDLPFAAWIETNVADTPPYYTFAVAQPVSVEVTRIFWVTTFPDSVRHTPDELDEGFLPFFAEDQVIVEQQRPEWLPLDVADELHLPFDKISVAYRRALADLGFPVIRLPRT